MTTVDADPRAQTWPEVDAFQDLLATLARGLDVREFFQRLVTIAKRIVPHDEAHFAVLTEDGGGVCLHAAVPDDAVEALPVERTSTLLDADDQSRLLDVVPGPDRGLQSGIGVPVKIDGRVVVVFALFPRQPDLCPVADLHHAQHLP